MFTVLATRYTDGPPGVAVGELPTAADVDGEMCTAADVDGEIPAAWRTSDSRITTTVATATAITAAAAASGTRARLQRRPPTRAAPGAVCCCEFAVFSDARFTLVSSRHPANSLRGTSAARLGEGLLSTETSYQSPELPGRRGNRNEGVIRP
jgi:hypothetical protein